jgi:hypothetical protein
VYFDPLAGLLFIVWSWSVRQLASDFGEFSSLREVEKDRRAATKVDDAEERGVLYPEDLAVISGMDVKVLLLY